MKNELNQDRILQQLSVTDIFADIPIHLLREHIHEFLLLNFQSDYSIIRKDDVGDSMYIIANGEVKIHDKDFVVATLHTGQYFGEMSLLHAAPRSMSVTALSEIELIQIKQDTFYNILKHQPELIQKIISNLVIRLRKQNNVLIEEYRSREADLKQQVEEQTALYREQKERAEQSEKFKQQFLANMSHEIRTPMNAVMGMTNLLLDKSPREDQFSYLNGIKQSSENLLHIINDILDLSKIEAGKMELEQINFSLHEVIHQVKQTLQHKADEKKLELKINIAPAIKTVYLGDPVRLNQIIMNLTGNAIKFTEQGSVTIQADFVEENNSNHTIRISIIDTGIGIAKEKFEQVFEGFSQANSSDTRKFGGTGLGLTISKQLVDMMGGKIGIESTEASYDGDPNHGTTFYFEVMLELGSEENFKQTKINEANLDGHILDHLSILIVDDNEYNRIVAMDTIQAKTSAIVECVDSGIHAISRIQETKFDIVLMDLQMPEMDGYEASRRIRQLPPPLSSIPIIALTASVLRDDLDRCSEAGMNSFIPKPFKSNELISGIANTLEIELKFIEIDPSTQKDESSLNQVTNLDYLFKFCEGNRVRMTKYIGMFTNAVPGVIEKLNEAIRTNNIFEIANQVHACRTKLVMMGMKETNEMSIQIERVFRDETIQDKNFSQVQLFILHLEKAILELV